MASSETSSHLPALAQPHERAAAARDLEATLQDLVNLALIGKQLHWTVIGPLSGHFTSNWKSSWIRGVSWATPWLSERSP